MNEYQRTEVTTWVAAARKAAAINGSMDPLWDDIFNLEGVLAGKPAFVVSWEDSLAALQRHPRVRQHRNVL